MLLVFVCHTLTYQSTYASQKDAVYDDVCTYLMTAVPIYEKDKGSPSVKYMDFNFIIIITMQRHKPKC